MVGSLHLNKNLNIMGEQKPENLLLDHAQPITKPDSMNAVPFFFTYKHYIMNPSTENKSSGNFVENFGKF